MFRLRRHNVLVWPLVSAISGKAPNETLIASGGVEIQQVIPYHRIALLEKATFAERLLSAQLPKSIMQR